MPRYEPRELTMEEWEARQAAEKTFERVAEAADEEGGPRLTLVPTTYRQEVWPTDLLLPPVGRGASQTIGGSAKESSNAGTNPDAADAAAAPKPAPVAAMPFDGVELEDSRKREAGWSAARQRIFLHALAEMGSVHLAAETARLTARSAYRLRARSALFAAAWDMAERLAAGRLSALAFDRAIHGRIEQVWHDGALVAEKKVPSDKLLMWLLARLDPSRYAAPWEQRKGDGADPQAEARTRFPDLLGELDDVVS